MYRYKYNRMIKDDIIVRGGWVRNVGKVWLLFHILYIKNTAIFFKLILYICQDNYSNTISTINYLNRWTLSKVMIVHSFVCAMVVWAAMVLITILSEHMKVHATYIKDTLHLMSLYSYLQLSLDCNPSKNHAPREEPDDVNRNS